MSKGRLLKYGLYKNVFILSFLAVSQIVVYDAIDTVCPCGGTAIRIVLTACGLLLAGAISGFFRISFENVIKSKAKGFAVFQLVLAHAVTGLQLFVIGILLLACVRCLSIYPPTNALGNKPFFLFSLLYASMVCYDLFDVLRLDWDNSTSTS